MRKRVSFIFVVLYSNGSHMNHTLLVSMSLFFFLLSPAQQLNHNAEAWMEIPVQAQFNSILSGKEMPDHIRHDEVEEQLNNKPLYRSGSKNGKLNGAWQSWYQNGRLCDSGTLVKGLPDGVWKHWDKEGRLLAVRTYHADKYHRIRHEIMRYHPRRVTYPLVVLYRKDEAAAKKYLHASYSFAKTPWKEDSHSITRLVTNNITTGNSYRPVFDHSLHHGLYKNFFSNGALKDSGYYQDGLKQGPWVHRTEKGMVSKGMYSQGKKVKEWKVYDADGRLKEIDFYTSSGKMKWKKSF